MKRIGVLLLLMMLMIRLAGQSQGIVTPPEGKTVIYFVLDKSIRFREIILFTEDSLIKGFQNSDYIVVTVDPGKHVFWVWSNEAVWMKADVAANKVYMVAIEVNEVSNGPTIRMSPVKDGSPRFWQLNRIIRERSPGDARQTKMNETELERLASASMARYRAGDVASSRILSLESDMDIGKAGFEVPLISH